MSDQQRRITHIYWQWDIHVYLSGYSGQYRQSDSYSHMDYMSCKYMNCKYRHY